MSGREESMRRHPSFQSRDRIQALIDAAQDQQALDLANREHSELEEWAGGLMCRVDEWHHDWSSRPRWTDWVVPAAMVTGLYVLVMLAAVAGEYVGGWPA